MITGIALTGMYKIGISASNKIKTPDGVIVDLEKIPFVRYRFQKYGEEELKFIVENKKRFPCAHIVEIVLDENTFDTINAIEDMDDMIAKIIYVDITDKEVTDGLSDETIELLEQLPEYNFDRLSIRDKSDTLFQLALDRLKRQVKEATDIREKDIGVCGGPCCFMDGNACLTALRAREIVSMYSNQENDAVSSANHEGKLENVDDLDYCVNKCGCVRYHIFNKDTEAPSSRQSGTDKTKKVSVKVDGTDKTIENEVAEKKPKVSKPKGYATIKW